MTMSDTAVVQVERVSKKFCRRLRYALWYGLTDLAAELAARQRGDDLKLRHAEFLAVDDVSFELRAGECIGLIGHNGAGKSTLLKMLNGLIRPDRGRITMRGRVGALIELGAGFSPVLTGRENIYINGAVLGFSKQQIDAKFDEIVDFAELHDAIDAPVQTYSSGMYVRLGFAVAAQLNPDIFLIDELLAVGDTAFRMKCFQHLLDIKNAGKTIVVVSHNMIDINRVCDRVMVMDTGMKIYEGDVSSGIATYEDLLLNQGVLADQRLPEAPAWIARVDLIDSQGFRRNSYTTGEDLIAEITLSATKKVTDARLIVHVMTPTLGTLGAFSSPHAGFSFDIIPPETVVRFSMRALPLLVGSYSLRLNLYGPEVQDFLHAVTNAVSFKVTGPPVDTFGYGVCHAVLFKHDWEMIYNGSSEHMGKDISLAS
ncbi:MAG TPA: ABC transporter ATP-binding protein [Candidatus Binatia bacterium]